MYIMILSDNASILFHLSIVKMYINSNFNEINIFTIFKNHDDRYISAASNLIKNGIISLI